MYDKVSRLMKPIDATKWIRHFLANRRNRPEPEWDLPLGLAPDLIVQLRPSIEQFQLGDGGGPASLIAHDAPKYRNSSEATRRIVDFWFEEEREHSRLLGQAVKRLHGKRIESHWSFSAFCASTVSGNLISAWPFAGIDRWSSKVPFATCTPAGIFQPLARRTASSV